MTLPRGFVIAVRIFASDSNPYLCFSQSVISLIIVILLLRVICIFLHVWHYRLRGFLSRTDGHRSWCVLNMKQTPIGLQKRSFGRISNNNNKNPTSSCLDGESTPHLRLRLNDRAVVTMRPQQLSRLYACVYTVTVNNSSPKYYSFL